ncbi:MAG: spore coat protein [Clostridia bacterium]|nr:spore coat protein [Clostridia bacterium]
MKLTICELSNLNELITSCVNTITCMSLFKNQVTNPELKALLCNHFPIHVEDYNRKVEFVKNADTATGKLNVPELNTSIFSENVNKSRLAEPITVNTNVTKLTDREIALSYFLTLKRAGKEYAISSMEATNPILRQFLKDAYTMSCNHSYEVYEWLAKNNYYPIVISTGEQTGDIASIYNPISL